MLQISPLFSQLIRDRLVVSTFSGHNGVCNIRLTFPLSDSAYLSFSTDSPNVFLHRKKNYDLIVGSAHSRASFVEFIYIFAHNSGY